MVKTPRSSGTARYKTVGRTRDGVEVLAPKTRSKTFTASDVRKAVEKALEEAGVQVKKPLRQTDALRVQQRSDGKFEVRRPGAKRASAVTETQTQAVERARELAPGTAPIAKRVRKVPGEKRGTWRKT